MTPPKPPLRNDTSKLSRDDDAGLAAEAGEGDEGGGDGAGESGGAGAWASRPSAIAQRATEAVGRNVT
jgi:hypothetical protein